MNYLMLIVLATVSFGCFKQDKENYPQIGEREEGDIRLNPAAVLTGKKVFSRNCSSCHGQKGEGVVGMGPRLNSPEFLGLANDEFIERTIREGRPGTFMTGFGKNKRLSKKIPDLVAYVRSWQNDLPNFREYDVDWKKKIEGSPEKGKKLYVQYCAYCHGDQGEGYSAGGAGTAIGGKGFLSQASDDYIKKTILVGRSGTAMRPFGHGRGLADISQENINDIVAFLRSLEEKN